MEGLEFLFSIIGFGLLIYWVLVHDKSPDQPTRGFFIMREPGNAPSTESRRAIAPHRN